MELLQYLEVIRKWIWLIVLATVLAAVSSLIASLLTVPVYKTTTTLIISQVIQSPNPDPSDIMASQQLVQTYVQLVRREPILTATIAALGLKQDWQSLRERVSATPVQGTQLLEISVLDTSPERAKVIADEIAHQLILQSPTTPSAEQQERLAFIRAQLPDLERKINEAKGTIATLDQTIAAAASAREILDAQQRQTVLQVQISQWQATYGQLVSLLQKGNLNYISVIEPAEIPRIPVSPKIDWNVMLASAIGLTLSVSAAFLLEYLDDRIRSPLEAQALVGAPVLAAIGRIEGKDYSHKLIAERDLRSPLTEGYRALRTNLQSSALEATSKTILITSPGRADGKSVTAANLAVVLAQAGISVILVDADLRRPVIHEIFGLRNHIGLTNWLVRQENEARATTGEARLWSKRLSLPKPYIQTTRVPRLRVITSGPLPPNPAEVLGSICMQQFLEAAAQMADVVILDSPPCVAVTDGVILARWADGVLLVLDSQNTRRQEVRRARESLQAVGAKVLGTVINRLTLGAGGYHFYSNSYQSDGKNSRNGRPPNALAKLFSTGKNHKASEARNRRPAPER